LQRFVGQNPTEAKTKIQGFALTDRLSAARLSSARGENMKKMIFTVLADALLLASGAQSAFALDTKAIDSATTRGLQI
jgi:hypothetical protein